MVSFFLTWHSLGLSNGLFRVRRKGGMECDGGVGKGEKDKNEGKSKD